MAVISFVLVLCPLGSYRSPEASTADCTGQVALRGVDVSDGVASHGQSNPRELLMCLVLSRGMGYRLYIGTTTRDP